MIDTESPLYKGFLVLNFSEKETVVYLSVLELGKSTVSKIARKAGISRTTCYHILDALVNKNLVSISGKEPKQEYVAESPENINKYMEGETTRLQRSVKLARDLVPQLKSMHNVNERPRVRFYEGREGLRQVFEDTLTSHEPIRVYASVNSALTALPSGYFREYCRRRARKGISVRAIIPNDEGGKDYASRDKQEARESVLVPRDKYYFSPEINVYDNKVMIASWKEKLGIVIESQEIADAMKVIYEFVWAEAKRLGQ